MIDKDAALLHHFLQMAKAQRVSCIPTAHTSVTSSGQCSRLSTLRSSGIIAVSVISCIQPLLCMGTYCDKALHGNRALQQCYPTHQDQCL